VSAIFKMARSSDLKFAAKQLKTRWDCCSILLTRQTLSSVCLTFQENVATRDWNRRFFWKERRLWNWYWWDRKSAWKFIEKV